MSKRVGKPIDHQSSPQEILAQAGEDVSDVHAAVTRLAQGFVQLSRAPTYRWKDNEDMLKAEIHWDGITRSSAQSDCKHIGPK